MDELKTVEFFANSIERLNNISRTAWLTYNKARDTTSGLVKDLESARSVENASRIFGVYYEKDGRNCKN